MQEGGDTFNRVVAEHETQLAIAGFIAICRYQGRLSEVGANRLALVAEIAMREPVAGNVSRGLVTLPQVQEWTNEAVTFSARSQYPTSMNTGEAVKHVGFFCVAVDGAFYCCACRSLWLAEPLTEHDVRIERAKAEQAGSPLRCADCGDLL